MENPVRKGLVGRCEDYPWVWCRRDEKLYGPDKSRLASLGGTAEAAVPT